MEPISKLYERAVSVKKPEFIADMQKLDQFWQALRNRNLTKLIELLQDNELWLVLDRDDADLNKIFEVMAQLDWTVELLKKLPERVLQSQSFAVFNPILFPKHSARNDQAKETTQSSVLVPPERAPFNEGKQEVSESTDENTAAQSENVASNKSTSNQQHGLNQSSTDKKYYDDLLESDSAESLPIDEILSIGLKKKNLALKILKYATKFSSQLSGEVLFKFWLHYGAPVFALIQGDTTLKIKIEAYLLLHALVSVSDFTIEVQTSEVKKENPSGFVESESAFQFASHLLTQKTITSSNVSLESIAIYYLYSAAIKGHAQAQENLQNLALNQASGFASFLIYSFCIEFPEHSWVANPESYFTDALNKKCPAALQLSLENNSSTYIQNLVKQAEVDPDASWELYQQFKINELRGVEPSDPQHWLMKAAQAGHTKALEEVLSDIEKTTDGDFDSNSNFFKIYSCRIACIKSYIANHREKIKVYGTLWYRLRACLSKYVLQLKVKVLKNQDSNLEFELAKFYSSTEINKYFNIDDSDDVNKAIGYFLQAGLHGHPDALNSLKSLEIKSWDSQTESQRKFALYQLYTQAKKFKEAEEALEDAFSDDNPSALNVYIKRYEDDQYYEIPKPMLCYQIAFWHTRYKHYNSNEKDNWLANEANALNDLKKKASQSDDNALKHLFMLGQSYSEEKKEGNPVSKLPRRNDLEKAIECFEVAALHNHPGALKSLESLQIPDFQSKIEARKKFALYQIYESTSQFRKSEEILQSLLENSFFLVKDYFNQFLREKNQFKAPINIQDSKNTSKSTSVSNQAQNPIVSPVAFLSPPNPSIKSNDVNNSLLLRSLENKLKCLREEINWFSKACTFLNPNNKSNKVSAIELLMDELKKENSTLIDFEHLKPVTSILLDGKTGKIIKAHDKELYSKLKNKNEEITSRTIMKTIFHFKR